MTRGLLVANIYCPLFVNAHKVYLSLLSLHPAQRVLAGNTGPALVSGHATSDGAVAWLSGACPADWKPDT